MTVFKRDEICAYWVNDGREVICVDCLNEQDTISDVITQQQRDDEELIILCDRSGHQC